MNSTRFLKREGVRVGDLTVIALNEQDFLQEQQAKFRSLSYHVNETSHFVVCQKPNSERTVLLHTFGQDEINADLICFIENELSPFGFMISAREHGTTLFAVLASTFPSPRDQVVICNYLGLLATCERRGNELKYCDDER